MDVTLAPGPETGVDWICAEKLDFPVGWVQRAPYTVPIKISSLISSLI